MLDNVPVCNFITIFKKMDAEGWEFFTAIPIMLSYRLYFRKEAE